MHGVNITILLGSAAPIFDNHSCKAVVLNGDDFALQGTFNNI